MNKLETPELKEEFKKIEEENKSAPEEKRETLTVDEKADDKEEPHDLSWVEAKRNFWTAYAAEVALSPDFTNPEDDKSPFYCKLSKDENVAGVVSYSAPNAAKISADSDFKIYQGLVKDAVQNGYSITFGESLNDSSKLMLYAAVLSSEEKYKDNKSAEAVNPPALSPELLQSETFAKLPDEVKKILQDAYIQQHAEELRNRIKVAKDKMTPEQKAAREQKEIEREKIMAARLGISPEYHTKNLKGNDRTVTKDDALFDKDGKLNESRISQEQYNYLLKYKTDGKGK